MKTILKNTEREAMHVDHYYKIGDSHEECQDYALSTTFNDELAFMCVADGCSSSHKRSRLVDIGARALALTSKRYFQTMLKSVNHNVVKNLGDLISEYRDGFSNSIFNVARCNLSSLLSEEDLVYALDSTLVVAIADSENAMVLMFGDGIISYETDSEVKRYEVSYSKNAPYYLSYIGDHNRNKLFKEMGQKLEVTNLDDKEDIQEEEDVDEFYKLTSFYIPDYKRVSIMSDGFSSFQHENGDRFDTLEAVTQATNFKNPVGEFVQRRIKMMLKKMSRKDIGHFDDISIASVIKG